MTSSSTQQLSFSTGTFLNNYDIIDRKLKPLLIGSTVGKQEKWEENTTVETTQILKFNPIFLLEFAFAGTLDECSGSTWGYWNSAWEPLR